MTSAVVLLGALSALVVLGAVVSVTRADRRRMEAEDRAFDANTTLLRVLRAASEGRLRVSRTAGGYEVSEKLSAADAARLLTRFEVSRG